MKAIAVDSGDGAVLPSVETVEAAEYQPLARPLLSMLMLLLGKMRR